MVDFQRPAPSRGCVRKARYSRLSPAARLGKRSIATSVGDSAVRCVAHAILRCAQTSSPGSRRSESTTMALFGAGCLHLCLSQEML